MEANKDKEVNYLVLSNILTGSQTIGKTEFVVFPGDVVKVNIRETEYFCTVDAVMSVCADSDAANFIDTLRCVEQSEIKKVWRSTDTQ